MNKACVPQLALARGVLHSLHVHAFMYRTVPVLGTNVGSDMHTAVPVPNAFVITTDDVPVGSRSEPVCSRLPWTCTIYSYIIDGACIMYMYM